MYSEIQKMVSNIVADNRLSGKIIKWYSKPHCFTGLILNLLSGEQVVSINQVLLQRQKLLSRHCFWGLIFGQCTMTHLPALVHNHIQLQGDPSQFRLNSWVGYFIFSLNVKTVRDSFMQKVWHLKRKSFLWHQLKVLDQYNFANTHTNTFWGFIPILIYAWRFLQIQIHGQSVWPLLILY